MSAGSRSFEDMLAYVDENGVLHASPQDVGPRAEIDLSEIEVSVPRRTETGAEEPLSGRVEYFTSSKGYGFIKDASDGEKYFSTSPTLRRGSPRATGWPSNLSAAHAA